LHRSIAPKGPVAYGFLLFSPFLFLPALRSSIHDSLPSSSSPPPTPLLDCNADAGGGQCVPDLGCVCAPNHHGRNCSAVGQAQAEDPFTRISSGPSGAQSTAAHSLVIDTDAAVLWAFGGYDLNRASDALLRFDLQTRVWDDLTVAAQQQSVAGVPAARYAHAAALEGQYMWVTGGVAPSLDVAYASRRIPQASLATSQAAFNPADADPTLIVADIWRLDTRTLRWLRFFDDSTFLPLSGHSLTAVGDGRLVVLGGQSRHPAFSARVFEIDTTSLKIQKYVPGGSQAAAKVCWSVRRCVF
jgi:hypothetical protein